MNAIRPIRMPAARAVTFKAWKAAVGGQGFDRFEAHPHDLPAHVASIEEAAQAASDCLSHKESIIVLRADAALRPERRNLVSVFVVKKRSQRKFIRLADGSTGREPEFYPDLVSQFCVHEGFEPVRPWRAEDGNPVGCDLTLVEG